MWPAEADQLPPVLRQLLADELAAGNAIIEIGHSHPAPPVGAYFMLARPISTRPRRSGEGVEFYERNSSLYSGEFTDAKRFYFLLEPPGPPPAQPDMDAIRAAHQPPAPLADARTAAEPPADTRTAVKSTAREKFVASMTLDYERWHEGIGYDIDALLSLPSGARSEFESRMSPPAGWRDGEALAALGTPSARQTLADAARAGDIEVRMAVKHYASNLVDDVMRTDSLVRAIAQMKSFGGLAPTLDAVWSFHPPPVVQALIGGLIHAPGDVAYHCAATLLLIHGITKSEHDWSHRPQCLTFNTDEGAARRAAFLTLCATIGVDVPARLAELNR